jgi:hypothetical protein
MIRIAFVHPHKSFLQNVEAYRNFFARYRIDTSIHYPEEAATINADCTWHFMGYDRRYSGKGITIHEYCSASVPPFSDLKNRIKKWMSAVPDYRIFNGQYVKDKFDFRDQVPSGVRDYGVTEIFREDASSTDKEFDFIYLGSVGKERNLDRLFGFFTEGPMKGKTLLVLSHHYGALAGEMARFPNIRFAGPVQHQQVSSYIRRCRYGINFIPDKIPYNRQASAKLLDYAASAIPVITTDYYWVRSFQEKSGGNFFFLAPDLANFRWKDIQAFPFRNPDLSGWAWEQQLQKCGVLAFLEQQFPGLAFDDPL